MKTQKLSVKFCRSRFFRAILLGIGIGWAMSVAINLGVGIAIGAGFMLIFALSAKQD